MSQRAIVLHPRIKKRTKESSPGMERSPAYRLEEAVRLAHAIFLEVVDAQIVMLSAITPSTYVGKGKVEEYADKVKQDKIDLAILDADISPVQQRNLEKAWGCKVIDRTALILEIFGERARTKEGQLQVELAACEYQKSRLVRSWTHLERQRGGSGFLGGPGETQIESDRRAIRERIGLLKKQLDKVVKTRELHRKARRAVPYPVVSLVGYTNAGKSTLFNKLTQSDVYAADALFATLDPTMRVVALPSGEKIILSDTVGFISDLPTELIAAFRATLEEVKEADIILHVRDIAHPETQEQKKDVEVVLESLALKEGWRAKIVEVYNKIDLLEKEPRQVLLKKSKGDAAFIAISATKGTGFATLLESLAQKLTAGFVDVKILVGEKEGKLQAWLHAHTHILKKETRRGKMYMEVRLSEKTKGQLKKEIQKHGYQAHFLS